MLPNQASVKAPQIFLGEGGPNQLPRHGSFGRCAKTFTDVTARTGPDLVRVVLFAFFIPNSKQSAPIPCQAEDLYAARRIRFPSQRSRNRIYRTAHGSAPMFRSQSS